MSWWLILLIVVLVIVLAIWLKSDDPFDLFDIFD